MNKWVLLVSALGGLSFCLAAGCADILGLEPAMVGTGGTGGSPTTGSGAGGTGTPTTCQTAAECVAVVVPDCQVADCVDGLCKAVPAGDGATVDCYEGPGGTEKVGECSGGKRTCTAGVPVGKCVGQTLPAAQENCGTAADDDCNGTAECGAVVLDARVFNASGLNALHGVAFDAKGDVYVTGVYRDLKADLFGCPLPLDAPGQGAFVAKLAGTSFDCQWVARLEATDGADLSQIVVAGDRVWAVGSVAGLLAAVTDDDGLPVTMAIDGGVSEAFAVVLGSGNGKLVDALAIGGPDPDYGVSIAVAENLVYLAVVGGEGTVRLLKQPNVEQDYMGAGGAPDTILLALSADGKLQWSRALGSSGNDQVRALGVVADRLLVGGNLFESATLDGCTLHGGPSSQAFLIDVAASDGVHTDKVCETFGGSEKSYTTGITGNKTGGFAAAGFVHGVGTLGICGNDTMAAGDNAWLRLGTLDIPCETIKAISGPTSSVGARAERIGSDVLFLGAYVGILEEGVASKEQDIFFHRYGADLGAPIWHLEFGAGENDEAWSFAVNPAGNGAVLVGSCSGGPIANSVDQCGKDDTDGYLVRVAF